MNISLARILDRQILTFKFYKCIHIYLQMYKNMQMNYQQQPEVSSMPESGVSNSNPPPSSMSNDG
jgi:hypothetical protein